MHVGKCSFCEQMAWVNMGTRRGEYIGVLCADCFERVPHDSGRSASAGVRQSSSGPNHNDPGFDNVIRAMEEDR